jgi:TolB-like protein
MSNLFTELKRRKVFRVAVVYAATGFVVLQAADIILPRLGVPDWAMSLVVMLMVLGFPVALVLGWALELTPDGIRRSEAALPEASATPLFGRRTLVITGLLLATGAGIGAGWFMKPSARSTDEAAGSRVDDALVLDPEAPWIMVASFDARGDDPELSALAASLRDEIASGLSRFPWLLVARQPIRGSHYVVDATLRRAGSTLRLSARLVETGSGALIWTATFDRDIEAVGVLEAQDDLTDHVVASIADPYGGLMRALSRPVAVRAVDTLTPYQAILRSFVFRERVGPADHLITRGVLERAVTEAPGNATLHAALALIILQEYMHAFNPLPGSLDRALAAARRAVELDPDNAYANFALAQVSFFRQDLGGFRAAAERAIALNPRDSDAVAMIGILMGYAGDWERGVALTTRAMTLNPSHPGYYRFTAFFDAYRQGKYEEALAIAHRVNLPGYYPDPMVRAMAHAQLGQEREAAAAAGELRALWPDLASFRDLALNNWMFAQPQLVQQIIDGLGKAGLEIP